MRSKGMRTLSGIQIVCLLGIFVLVNGCSKANQAPGAEQAKNQQPKTEQAGSQAPNAEQIKNPLITAEQMKADLLNKTIPLGGKRLETFDKLENFKDVQILKESKQGDRLEYTVKIDYNDTTYGTVDKIEAIIIYTQAGGKWTMASSTGKLL